MEDSKQVIRTRRDITNSLLELMLEKNFDDISVVDICEKALVTRATFYKYFEDKYHLISCIIEDYKEQILQKELENYEYKTPKQLYMKVAEICLKFVEDNIERVSLFFQNGYNDRLRLMLLQTIDENIENILQKQTNLVKYKVPISVLSKYFTGGFTYLGVYLFQNKGKYSKKQIMSFLDVMLDESAYIL